ncbi:MAG: Re/Si-specific NAD(P)(+) transhydrogenase subunit alpha [Myxococcales bacterium]|nr:Re/Si-specific NAD(P)(+) transhydrogenase subunit alpha [Myxococcota bacterium]MDW8281483.1 Re/Si-specific NAD(P)(+) transhydrogenase subunit alpha [Myxococcales bacterium]
MRSVFVPKEEAAGETRVAATPETVRRLVKEGFSVTCARGAGAAAHFSDEALAAAGATITEDVVAAWQAADVVLCVQPPKVERALLLKQGAVLIGFMQPHRQLTLVRTLRDRGTSTLALELLPRITRAQPMDALSSQASVAGYKAVLVAAERLDKFFPLLMTAGGTIQPARVVVLGAGVAGLQAVATARRLGAVVEVSDVRPEVKEQVQSIGGRFIDLPGAESGAGAGGYAKEMSAEFLARQRATLHERIVQADVVICTALVPGRPAPRLVEEATVRAMRPGAVVVDLAVVEGGNCALSVLGQEVEVGGVRILGPANLPATMPQDASLLYARNVLALLLHVAGRGDPIQFDLADEIVRGVLLTHKGEVLHAPTAARLGGGPA